MYQCKRCGYKTDIKGNYALHIGPQRKAPCPALYSDVPIEDLRDDLKGKEEKVNPYQCETCGKRYASRGGLSYHKRNEKSRCDVPQQILHRIKELEEKISTIHTAPTIIGNNNFIGNVNITINTFGQESKEYISLDFARTCLELGWCGVEKMMDKIYFDKQHPENHNVKLKSLKNHLVEVFKGHGWEARGLNDTLDTMINHSGSEIINKVTNVIINEPSEENVMSLQAISNLKPSHKKRIKERAKGKLVYRRDVIQR